MNFFFLRNIIKHRNSATNLISNCNNLLIKMSKFEFINLEKMSIFFFGIKKFGNFLRKGFKKKKKKIYEKIANGDKNFILVFTIILLKVLKNIILFQLLEKIMTQCFLRRDSLPRIQVEQLPE